MKKIMILILFSVCLAPQVIRADSALDQYRKEFSDLKKGVEKLHGDWNTFFKHAVLAEAIYHDYDQVKQVVSLNIEDKRTCMTPEVWERERLQEADTVHVGTYIKKNGIGVSAPIVAFEGTSSLYHVLIDAQQIFTIPLAYMKAIAILAEEKKRVGVGSVAGHSLGGGLAQFAAAANGSNAFIFNPAGLGVGSSGAYKLLKKKQKIGPFQVTQLRSLGYFPKDDGKGIGSKSFIGDLVSFVGLQLKYREEELLVELLDFSPVSDSLFKRTFEYLVGRVPTVLSSVGNMHFMTNLKTAISFRLVRVSASLTSILYFEYLLDDYDRVLNALESANTKFSQNQNFYNGLKSFWKAQATNYVEELRASRERLIQIYSNQSLIDIEMAGALYKEKNILKQRGGDLRASFEQRAGQLAQTLPLKQQAAFLRPMLGAFGENWVAQDFNLCGGNSSQGPSGEPVLAFIIDRSGSMGEISVGQDNRKSQKLARALGAVKAKVKVMKDDEYLSISSFASGGSTQLVSTSLSTARSKIPQTLANITAGGGTNIGAGLAEGRKQLEKSGGGYALLLSDGKGGGWQGELVKYKAKKWKICTIAYGADADVATLQRIANESGCTFTPSDASNVANRMHDVDAYAKNRSSSLAITDFLAPSAQVFYPFKVSFGSVLFNLFTSWQGSRLSTVLVSPSGQRIDVENINPEEGRYIKGDTFQYVELNKPEAGEWTIEASWSEAPDSAELVNFSIAEQSEVFSRIHNFNSYYRIGETVDLLVDAMEIINDEKQALANTTVQVDVQVPGQEAVDLIFDPTSPIDIYQKVAIKLSRGQDIKDDGQSGDYAPADGIFGGQFIETNNPGIYLVKATITGQKSDGTKVSREALSTFQVGSVLKNPITTSQLLGFYKKSWNKITEKEIADDDFYSTAAEDVQELLNDNEGIEDLMGGDDDSVLEGMGFD